MPIAIPRKTFLKVKWWCAVNITIYITHGMKKFTYMITS